MTNPNADNYTTIQSESSGGQVVLAIDDLDSQRETQNSESPKYPIYKTIVAETLPVIMGGLIQTGFGTILNVFGVEFSHPVAITIGAAGIYLNGITINHLVDPWLRTPQATPKQYAEITPGVATGTAVAFSTGVAIAFSPNQSLVNFVTSSLPGKYAPIQTLAYGLTTYVPSRTLHKLADILVENKVRISETLSNFSIWSSASISSGDHVTDEKTPLKRNDQVQDIEAQHGMNGMAAS